MSVLVIGPLESFLGNALQLLFERGHRMTQVPNPEKALSLMREGHSTEIILMDIDQDIPRFMTKMAQERFSVSVVACSQGPIDKQKVKVAIEAGAKEFIPFPPDAHLIADIFDSFYAGQNTFLFQDPLMKKVIEVADKVASSDASVLITGESGTGKEGVARYLHEKSKRAKKVFLSVNCAAIPEQLLESELFGHEKGAFTGAVARRIGKFEEAAGGTLLLDEITEMHPRLQAKILRALQEREIDRVGGSKPVKVNFRLLATSNRDMSEAIREGIFREDLYFRLNVINLHLPPLRKRAEDIPLLATYFVKHYAHLNGMKVSEVLEPDTLQLIQAYHWPGNVRELENVMHRAVLLAENGTIHPSHLGLEVKEEELSAGAANQDPLVGPLVGQTVEAVERKLVLSTMANCNQDSMRAAKLLGLSMKALRIKLEAYQKEQEIKLSRDEQNEHERLAREARQG